MLPRWRPWHRRFWGAVGGASSPHVDRGPRVINEILMGAISVVRNESLDRAARLLVDPEREEGDHPHGGAAHLDAHVDQLAAGEAPQQQGLRRLQQVRSDR